MATVEFSKEMVDLLTKIKKHLREKSQISISLADPQVLDKLVELRTINDPLLQGMIRYLMALAGQDWPAKYEGTWIPPEAPSHGAGEAGIKKLFNRYLNHPVQVEQDKQADTSTPEGSSWASDAPQPPERKPVRYYRGQPVYDD